MEHVAVIITGAFSVISAIVIAYFAYNQHTKNKMTDLKIEQVKKDSEENTAKNNRHTAIIYGELWKLLHQLDVDRCFILQPHPKNRHSYVSVVFEVDRAGVSLVKDILQNIPMSEIAQFSNELVGNCWLYYQNIDDDVLDPRIRSLMRLGGASNVAIKQLINSSNDWIGSLMVENTTNKKFKGDEKTIKEAIKVTANTIQYILPSIN